MAKKAALTKATAPKQQETTSKKKEEEKEAAAVPEAKEKAAAKKTKATEAKERPAAKKTKATEAKEKPAARKVAAAAQKKETPVAKKKETKKEPPKKKSRLDEENEEEAEAKLKDKKQTKAEPDLEELVEKAEKEEEDDGIDGDGDDDDKYADLDEEELLALALKDDEEETTKLITSDMPPFRPLRSKKNVLYLGHVPEGFYEHEIKGFLSQFGKILNVRVSRSAKTGKSRGYAFVQAKDADVAEIIRKTMHGYVLMGRSLVCQVVPVEHVHPRTFWGGLSGPDSKVVTFEGIRNKRVLAHGQVKDTAEAKAKRVKRLVQKDKTRKSRLDKKGIKYDFTGYAATAKSAA